jgi:hypothetical protein
MTIILELPCSGETHRIEILEDGTAVMLDHDEEMVRAFIAFNAAVPPCFVVQQQINDTEKVYRATAGKWTGVDWHHRIGVNRLDVLNMTSERAHDLGRKAMATERERVRAAKKALDEAWQELLEESEAAVGFTPADVLTAPSVGKLYDLKGNVYEAEEDLKRARAVVSDWRAAWQYILKVEQVIQDTEAKMAAARALLLQGRFATAYSKADTQLRELLRHHFDRVHEWRFYVNNLLMLQDMAGAFEVRVASEAP